MAGLMGAFMKTATKAMTQAATAAVQPPKAAKPKPAKSKPAAKPRAAAPRSARFETGTHTCAHGTRKYRVYLPSAIGAGVPLPLLVMLHGCGQTPEDFARGTGMNALAEQRGDRGLSRAAARGACEPLLELVPPRGSGPRRR